MLKVLFLYFQSVQAAKSLGTLFNKNKAKSEDGHHVQFVGNGMPRFVILFLNVYTYDVCFMHTGHAKSIPDLSTIYC